ncbi:transketolase [Nocardioides sp. GY 10127]|nr:transketolase [Nocardioides sp. GY 10127]
MLACDEARTASWRDARARFEKATPEEQVELLAEQARLTRLDVLETISGANLGHIGGDYSVTDLLTTLYFGVLNVDPAQPRWDERDFFVLSKGHCAAALYTTLSHAGFFPREELPTFAQPLSDLNGHPNRNKVPGVETNTGPLGHGLPVAVGCAYGARLRGTGARAFAIMGDGEMQEGSNWEAIMSAAQLGLDNLTLVVDRNRLQQGARTEETNALDPLDEKLAAFGCEVRVIDGHDFTQILAALAPSTTGKPVAIVANTVKGKGVSFMEDRVEWHHKVPSAEQVEQARQELAGA